MGIAFWTVPASALVYQVKRGDTLTKIAKRYKVSINQLKSWNQIKTDHIYIGQSLHIYPEKDYIIKKDYYVVRRGDTLSEIARRTHTTVKSLIKINHLKSTTIRPGQRLLVRVRRIKKRPVSQEVPVPLVEPKPIIEANIIFHTVKEGETLDTIARQYGLEPQEIREANLIPEAAPEIKKGQILAIPQPEGEKGEAPDSKTEEKEAGKE